MFHFHGNAPTLPSSPRRRGSRSTLEILDSRFRGNDDDAPILPSSPRRRGSRCTLEMLDSRFRGNDDDVPILPSSPRRRGSRAHWKCWIPAFVGMTMGMDSCFCGDDDAPTLPSSPRRRGSRCTLEMLDSRFRGNDDDVPILPSSPRRRGSRAHWKCWIPAFARMTMMSQFCRHPRVGGDPGRIGGAGFAFAGMTMGGGFPLSRE